MDNAMSFQRHKIDSICTKHTKQKMDTATLYINTANYSQNGLAYWWQSEQCFKCPLVKKCSLNPVKPTLAIVDSTFGSILTIKDKQDNIICNKRYHFGENGVYNLTLNKQEDSWICDLSNWRKPDNSFLPILYACIFYFGLALLYYVGIWAYNKHLRNVTRGDTEEENQPSTSENNEQTVKPRRRERLKFLDLFRGICIVVMIFVNYGGGGYYFFRHSEWNGLTVADLVFPWFMFIMGTSMALSFESISIKSIPRRSVWYKIVRRTAILFALGLFVLNGPNSWHTLRIMGVLQRFAIAYFVVATLRSLTAAPSSVIRDKQRELSYRGVYFWIWSNLIDIWYYWIEWLIYGALMVLWLSLTFLLPVPGCPRGYIGPGGLNLIPNENNCTGGSAGYIDRIILGQSHVYQTPTARRLYDTVIPYDPEGLLGSLMSILAVFLGLQAGQILLIYDHFKSRAIRFSIWALIYGILAGILCGFSQNNGVIPVNKNLWSLTFVLSLACFANILITITYYITDVRKWWNGAPFYFVGMNSIALYMLHEVFSGWLFVGGWKQEDTHGDKLLANLWGTSFWVIVAYYMHYIEFYVII